MKPLNDFEMWIVKFIIGEDYFLARFGEKDGHKGCYLHANGYSIMDLMNLKNEIDDMLNEHIAEHISVSHVSVGEPSKKKRVRKAVKKVAKKHE